MQIEQKKIKIELTQNQLENLMRCVTSKQGEVKVRAKNKKQKEELMKKYENLYEILADASICQVAFM